MGILQLLCVAAGPRNTLYAFAKASTYGNSAQLPSGEYYVIAKSNANPTFFTEMTWPTVTAINSSAFSMFKKVSTCVVSDQGVVTVFGLYYEPSTYDPKYVVIRYDPSTTTSNIGQTSIGLGRWMNITAGDSYARDRSTYKRSLAFYTKDTAAGGAQRLIHLSYGNDVLPVLFGVVDETTRTLSHVANWTMASYYLEAKVFVYPFTGLPSTIPPEPRIVDAVSTYYLCSWTSNILSGVWGNSYRLLCPFQGNESFDSKLYTINNISQGRFSIDTGITIAEGYDMIDYFIPMVSTPDFAFMVETDTRFSSPGMYAIQVSGDGAGTVRGLMPIIVPETLGKQDVPSKYPYPNRASDSTGLIVAVFIGVLVALFLTIYYFYKRLSDRNDKKKQAVQAALEEVHTQEHNQTEVVEDSEQATQHIVRPAEIPMAQVPGMDGSYQTNTAAPIAISDAGTISPATATATMITAPILQSGQDQMQHLQLSSHPRPNFVTSVGENNQSNSQQHRVKSGPEQ
ncbi:hypothetical protein BGX34_001602 [Mortierella sp. NVP85]|nr:hypothetical protein BGX34_001602 [Mortierella sp. NVP85]